MSIDPGSACMATCGLSIKHYVLLEANWGLCLVCRIVFSQEGTDGVLLFI